MNAERQNSEYEFRDNVLHIWTPQVKMRLRWFPKPLAKERDHRGVWLECWPEFRVVAPHVAATTVGDVEDGFLDAKREAFLAFRRTIPQGLCRIVEPFRSHQWNLLRLIEKAPSARELASGNPVLAYALANSDTFHKVPEKAVVTLAVAHSHGRQRAICEWLGYPGTQSMVRLMKKIRTESASPLLLRRLRLATRLDEGVIGRLNHLRRVNAGAIELIIGEELKPVVTPKLLNEVAEHEDELHYGQLADQIRHALYMLKQIGSQRRVRPLTSIRKAEQFVVAVDEEYLAYQRHQEEAEATRRAERERLGRQTRRTRASVRGATRRLRPEDCPWPPPPVPGRDSIVPITSYKMLCEEAERQSNCVKSYWKDVAKHRAYIYRILRPERATLLIVNRSGGDWFLSQIKGPRNRKVSERTKNLVQTWLSRHAVSASLP